MIPHTPILRRTVMQTAMLFSCLLVQAQEEGFVSRFNGWDLSGWRPKLRSEDPALVAKVFAVEDGVIHVFKDLPDGHELDTGKNDTHGMIYTADKCSRFIFRFEYKWGKKRCNNFKAYQYNAGMYYHVTADKIWPTGVESQVRYDHTQPMNHTGDFWASGVRFQWYADDTGRFALPGEGGRIVSRKGGEHLAKAAVPFHALDDEWNQCEVIMMGKYYAIHKLNGVIVNLGTGLDVGEGLIGLQSETAEIFNRNIRLKTFDKDVPIGEFLK